MDDSRIEAGASDAPPPLPPAAGLVFAGVDPVAIRETHIRHERQLKSVGALYGFFAVLFCLGGAMALLPAADGKSMPVFGLLLLLPFGALFAVLAYGYRTLKPWVKIAGTGFAVLGLIGVPVGTLISGYILYLIWCSQGQRVLADDYAAIVRATPHVRYRPTVGDQIALALFVLIVVAIAALIYF